MARPISFDPELALEEAIELFWTKGYHNASVEDIVQATGLNRHSLYVRFGSKLGLLRAALERHNQRGVDRLDAICGADAPVKNRLRQLLALREPSNADPVFGDASDRGCFQLAIGTELRNSHPEFRIAMDEMGRQVEQFMLTLVREGQENGEVRTDCSAEDLAAVLMGGFMLPLVYSQERQRFDGLVSVLHSVV
ncbi:MAG: TetR/AcrR family transcriptional repressor of nem operon [Pseudohongiellaceae bacterium]|jgi:TetR/AcrR family transcriptional repressor of nem operon